MGQIFGVLFAAGGTLIGCSVGFKGISPLLFRKGRTVLIKNAKKDNTYKAPGVTSTTVMFLTLFGGFCGFWTGCISYLLLKGSLRLMRWVLQKTFL